MENIGNAIRNYFNAGFPAIAVESQEPLRLVREILAAFAPGEAKIWRIAFSGVLRDARGRQQKEEQVAYPGAWRRAAEQQNGPHIIIAEDWQHVCRTPPGYRPLLDAIPAIKHAGGMVILVAPTWQLPPEIEREVVVVQHELPRKEAVRDMLIRLGSGTATVTEEAVEAALGLTEAEAENAAALAYDPQSGTFDAAIIAAEKIRRIRETAGLEIAPAGSLDAVGGLDQLKDWLQQEVSPFRRHAKLAVRGMLFVGPPGVGKSITARAVGAVTQSPVIRLDLAACRGQYQGQTEQTVRHALRVAEAVAPCVLWLDEIDSALGGHVSSGATDGGVTLNVISMLLTWVEQYRAPITLVGTANHPERIPAQLMRPGRIGDIWCVDLPGESERADIARIHLTDLDCYGPADDPAAAAKRDQAAHIVAAVTPDYSGAEIAGVIRAAARRSNCAPTKADLTAAANAVTPLARSRKADLDAMRAWATTHARAANRPAETNQIDAKRKLRASA